ncbi:FtsQ-type POTRA domain-containing protein [Corallococcus sp. CA053C]|uniref:FtsQ-type POTRA domain-containing protein n=1 Tax=Corallococcus sp. CA053C TaxID=2316732 RepID=UPI000EA0E951|nr:FtsQ-type POTRA domain-containing protein [Corallococcus sp. CA053C]RKH12671.1 FtsQ-type POTRA domain-containing protein [Corallococcus sp. CA053C]
MRNTSIILVVLHVVGLPALALAQEPKPGLGVEAAAPEPQPLTGRIERIEIQGNTRTKDSVIIGALRMAPGDSLTAGDVAELKRRLLNLKLFTSVEVSTRTEGTGIALQVAVEERWTLLPLPIFTSSNGQWQAGLFAVESNLFGLNKTLVLGGLGGNRGGTLFSMYRDASILGSHWTGLVLIGASKTDRERRVKDVVVDGYTDRRFDIAGTLGYQLTPELNVGLGLFSVTNRPLVSTVGAQAPQRGAVHGVTVMAEYLAQDFHFYFNEGLVARASYREGVRGLGSSRDLQQLSLFASYTLPVLGTHALTLTATHGLSRGDPFLDAQLLGGVMGSRGFTSASLWAETASTATLEYQVPLWSPRLATFTAHAFVDFGRVKWRDSVTRYATPGAGFRVYIRDVAIPALGFEVVRDPESGDLLPVVAVGFGF